MNIPDEVREAVDSLNKKGLAAEARARSALVIVACLAKENGGKVRISDQVAANLHPDFSVSSYRDELTCHTVFELTEPDPPLLFTPSAGGRISPGDQSLF